jgi:hypothetical protein
MATKKWSGQERRTITVCGLHNDLMENYRKTDEKVDKIITNQNTYMTTTDNLVKLVTNGLKTKVDEVAQTMAEIKLRSDTVDTFQWFITLANSFKEKLAINVIKIMAVGGILAFIWSFMSSGGSKVGEAILKAIIK